MKNIAAALIVSACLLLPAIASADEEVIDGIPYYKVMSSQDETGRFELNEYEGMATPLVIKKKNGKYYWASRGDRELVFTMSDGIATLVDPSGTGYIRIKREKKKCVYMEHLTYEMQTLTYWGEAKECSLP